MGDSQVHPSPSIATRAYLANGVPRRLTVRAMSYNYDIMGRTVRFRNYLINFFDAYFFDKSACRNSDINDHSYREAI